MSVFERERRAELTDSALTVVAEAPLLLIGRDVAGVGGGLTGAVEVTAGSRPLTQAAAGQRVVSLKLMKR